MFKMDTAPWNWLEVAKIGASLLAPTALAIFGIYVHRITKQFEHLQWRSQKLVEKRLAVYEELAPLLNDLLCYFTFVGQWRDLNPQDVVAVKRKVDKMVHLAAPLFSAAFFKKCMTFQSLCFETYTGWGRDAELRTPIKRRRESRSDWSPAWDECCSANVSEAHAIRTAYGEVMEAFAIDIGVHRDYFIPKSGHLPSNIT